MSKTKQGLNKPKFSNEDEEAKWWASAKRRAFLKGQSHAPARDKHSGSALVSRLNRAGSVQIALRLPVPAVPDVAQAREIAERNSIGYQTLLKMLVHEGLQREARPQSYPPSLYPHSNLRPKGYGCASSLRPSAAAIRQRAAGRVEVKSHRRSGQ